VPGIRNGSDCEGMNEVENARIAGEPGKIVPSSQFKHICESLFRSINQSVMKRRLHEPGVNNIKRQARKEEQQIATIIQILFPASIQYIRNKDRIKDALRLCQVADPTTTVEKLGRLTYGPTFREFSMSPWLAEVDHTLRLANHVSLLGATVEQQKLELLYKKPNTRKRNEANVDSSQSNCVDADHNKSELVAFEIICAACRECVRLLTLLEKVEPKHVDPNICSGDINSSVNVLVSSPPRRGNSNNNNYWSSSTTRNGQELKSMLSLDAGYLPNTNDHFFKESTKHLGTECLLSLSYHELLEVLGQLLSKCGEREQMAVGDIVCDVYKRYREKNGSCL
jgi:hypothetical protein